MNNSTYRAQLVTNLVNFVAANGLDGVDIDLETGSSIQASYSAFLSALRSALPAGKIISVCGTAEWANPSNQWFSVSAVNTYVDFVNLMMYDVRPFPESSKLADIQTYTQEWLNAGFTPAKLNLGIPAFGYAPAGGLGDYSQIIANINPANNTNSTTATTPWTTSPAEYWWSGYNLNQSKVQYAQSKNLGGIMIYAANEDACGNAKSVISAVSSMLSSGFTAGSVHTVSFQVTVAPTNQSCQVEVYLGVNQTTKAATSGLVSFTSTGSSQALVVTVTMPAAGTYNTYIDLYMLGVKIKSFTGTTTLTVT
jgi:GH18 family chitinase